MIDEVHEPGFGDRKDVREALEESTEVVAFLERHWPLLTPEQMLNDLFGSGALLRASCRAAGLGESDAELLARSRVSEGELWRRRWFRSDVPLLDELLWLLGDVNEAMQVEADMEHQFADEDDVFTVDEQREDEADLDDDEEDKLEPEPGLDDLESYDAWRDGDEEEEPWR